MARKDYYVTLGVSRGENLRGIQHAFRDLAKRYHPDRLGPAGTQKFQDLQEAYEILSDPEKRKLYNRELEQEKARLSPGPESLFLRRSYRPEPLIPEKMSVLHDFRSLRPSFESLFDRLVRNFTGEGIPKGERVESLNVEAILSPSEAARGGVVSMGIPVFYECSQCGGTGRDWLFPCMKCNAQGIMEAEETVKVPIPPMVPDRAIIELPIQGLGIHNFYLCLHIRIAPTEVS
jgi:molecular chaperone DnaJ